MSLAITCNETGIKASTLNHDFRSLYLYCVQATQILKLPREKRLLLYSQINTDLSDARLTLGEYHQFYLYFPRIKKLLFDTPNDNPVLTFTIHTNIDPDDYEKLAVILDVLEKAAVKSDASLDSKHIEIRHNSPDVIDLIAAGELQNLIPVLHHIYSVLSPAIADISSVITVGGAIGGIGKYMHNKLQKRTPKIDKKGSASDIAKLRKELNHMIQYEEESYMQSSSYHTNNTIDLNMKLKDIRYNLKNAGIEITGLEIQFLDGKEDILDALYQQDIWLSH